jgi:hypothetical protein
VIIVVQIENAFAGDVSGIKTILGDLLAYLNKTNSTRNSTACHLAAAAGFYFFSYPG